MITKAATRGRNGVGIKATNTWSLFFEIEILSALYRKKFVQRFENNMEIKHKPSITTYTYKTSSVSVKWMPDYERLGMGYVKSEGLNPQLKSFLESRVYEVCVCTATP